MTGEQTDILERLKSGLPSSWFGDSPANLEAMQSGTAQAYAYAYLLYLYAKLQTRIKTATGPFLDAVSVDFFGNTLPREAGETDSAYLGRILARIFRPVGTRAALSSALEAITGYKPDIYEPWRPADTGAYGANCGAGYGAGGAYGSQAYPYQCWCTAYRVAGMIGGNAGYGTPVGAYGSGSAMHYVSANNINATDKAIFEAAEAVKPAGTIIWLALLDPDTPARYLSEYYGALLTDENGFILTDEYDTPLTA